MQKTESNQQLTGFSLSLFIFFREVCALAARGRCWLRGTPQYSAPVCKVWLHTWGLKERTANILGLY